MATDIAFALGILAMFGKRAPIELKVFLTALAIADDLGAVLVIAVFYTEQIVISGLLIMAMFMILIFIANRIGIRQLWIYILFAIGVWAGVLASGVHATVAGVLVAMLVPVKAAIDPKMFLSTAKKRIDQLEKSSLTRESMVLDKEQMDALDDIYLVTEDIRPAGLSLEHQLHPVQSFLILPLFALFKAGVSLGGDSIIQLGGTISIGIILGLFFGKQLGILFFSWLAVRVSKTRLPDGISWSQIWGVSILAGVGFTMSIFISDLAFTNPDHINQAKIGIIVASLLSGIIGYVVLRKTLNGRHQM
jgi:NhaA family Na+:H+ antiporter